MATISPGTYTFQQVFDLAGFDLASEAAAEYNDGNVDHRRVKVGRLGFDSPDELFVVPAAAETVDIELDGKVVSTLTVE